MKQPWNRAAFCLLGRKPKWAYIRLGVLPKSRKWDQVVDELHLGKGIDAVAASAADAAEASLQAAANDPAFLHAFWLLTQVPLAARGPNFGKDLRLLGIQVRDNQALSTWWPRFRVLLIDTPESGGAAPTLARWRRWRP